MKLWPLPKFLVLRRDGTMPEWPYFVLGGRDPSAPAALRAYAVDARERGMDPTYCDDVEAEAALWEQYREEHGEGDPDAPPHRSEDPEIMSRLRSRRGGIG